MKIKCTKCNLGLTQFSGWGDLSLYKCDECDMRIQITGDHPNSPRPAKPQPDSAERLADLKELVMAMYGDLAELLDYNGMAPSVVPDELMTPIGVCGSCGKTMPDVCDECVSGVSEITAEIEESKQSRDLGHVGYVITKDDLLAGLDEPVTEFEEVEGTPEPEPPVRIRIKKCTGGRHWYAQRIGEVFEVVYQALGGYVTSGGTVDTRDCDVVEEEP